MPKKENGTNTRHEILRVAADLFADKGFHGTSTRDIASGVGIKQPSLFAHFESKAAIMMELQRLAFEPSLRLLQLAHTTDADPIARLFGALYADVRRIVASPFAITGTTSPTALNDPTFATGRELWDEIVDLQGQLIEAAIQDPRFIDVAPSFANRAVAWLMEGVIADTTREGVTNPHEVADQFASFVMSALLRTVDDLDTVRARGHEIAEQLTLHFTPIPS